MKGRAGKVFSAFGFTQLVMVAAIGAALYLAYTPWRWGKIREDIIQRYPQIDHIDPLTLDRWMREVRTQPDKHGPVLLDVRPEAEFNAGHIPSARNVRPGAKPDQMNLFSKPENRASDLMHPIVVYCSVGYDSSEVADYLKRAGFNRVQMLDGGIFRWANERRALVNAAGVVVNKVNPGKSPYAGLLNQSSTAK